MPFLYGTEHRKDTRKLALNKFLQRHRISIEQEGTHMTEALAFQIVKSTVTKELAEHIVKSAS